jgi:hypothetical protein
VFNAEPRSYGCDPPGQAMKAVLLVPDLKRPAQRRGNCELCAGFFSSTPTRELVASCRAGRLVRGLPTGGTSPVALSVYLRRARYAVKQRVSAAQSHATRPAGRGEYRGCVTAARSEPLDARELAHRLPRRLEPLDLSLTLWRDQPKALLAERVHVHLADAQERTRCARLPCCGLAVAVHGCRG